jgi:hypothetical protein
MLGRFLLLFLLRLLGISASACSFVNFAGFPMLFRVVMQSQREREREAAAELSLHPVYSRLGAREFNQMPRFPGKRRPEQKKECAKLIAIKWEERRHCDL